MKFNDFKVIGAAAALAAMPVSALAQTAPPSGSNALSQCLVLKSTGQDRQVLVRWVLGAMASSSLATDLVKVDPVAKDQADQAVAKVFARLLSEDCLNETRALTKDGNNTAISEGFRALGQIAMHDATQDPSVANAIGAFVRYTPKEALDRLRP